VDVDVASAAELERLPRVGPALAGRIVSEREAHGAFGSLEGMKRVSGMGPSTLAGFEKTATFSATLRTSVAPFPVVGPAPYPLPHPPCSQPISLNTATAAELECLPGVGPSLAARIVTWRTAHGPFAEVKLLEQVPGIGPARVRRLAALVRVP
jgi:competence ComEA-like helix-hairpin-helix protein